MPISEAIQVIFAARELLYVNTREIFYKGEQMKKSALILSLATATAVLSAPVTYVNPKGEYTSSTALSLQGILDSLTVGGPSSVNVATEQIADDEVWQKTNSNTTGVELLVEIAGYRNGNTFGLYDINNTSNKIQVFAGANSPLTSYTIFINGANQVSVWDLGGGSLISTGALTSPLFGFYLTNAVGQTLYSQVGKNSDGFDHMVTYQGEGDVLDLQAYQQPKTGTTLRTWNSGAYILAWEDIVGEQRGKRGSCWDGQGKIGPADCDYNDMIVMVESMAPVPEPTTIGLMGLGLLGLFAVARRKIKK